MLIKNNQYHATQPRWRQAKAGITHAKGSTSILWSCLSESRLPSERLGGVMIRGALKRDQIRRSPICPFLTICVMIGAVLDLNGYLTRQYHNNWREDKSWDWNQEIALITGGSGGIGASVAQTLLERNPQTRVVVIDHVSLALPLQM